MAWPTYGPTGNQEDYIQQAIDTTTNYLETCGLTCAPSKSAHLILWALTRGRPPNPTPEPTVTINGQPVRIVQTLRILGIP